MHTALSMLDILFCTVPRLQLRAPLSGPAFLKACLERKGFKAKCIDFNLDLWKRVKNDDVSALHDSDLTFRYRQNYENFKSSGFDNILQNWVDQIVSQNAKFVGFTSFSQRNSYVIRDLCKLLREHPKSKHFKIVIGGPYLDLSKKLLRSGLVDYAILGDAEEAIVDLVSGNTNRYGINDEKVIQLHELSNLPIPDYSDFPLEEYPNFDPSTNKLLGTDMFYITGSRGCVRSCTFCDVGAIWNKFRFRPGEDIANEMIELYRRHKITHFYFTDSLINGSLRLLEKLCETLITFKKQQGVNFTWQAQFICNSINRMKPHYYSLMKEAGCTLLSVGIESGSESVRDHMQKRFSNKDIYDMMKECLKVDLNVAFLMLVGYPTETEEDFQQTLELIKNMVPYRDVMKAISIGSTMSIVPGSPIEKMVEEMGIHFNDVEEWTYKDNNLKVRLKRWLDLEALVSGLGFDSDCRQKNHVLHLYNQLNETENARL